MSEKRTAKDEAEYVKSLRREESIKTEVIIELRQQNKDLWTTQATLLEALIANSDALRVYRQEALERARWASAHAGSCAPGCQRHTWDSNDGWYRVSALRSREDGE